MVPVILYLSEKIELINFSFNMVNGFKKYAKINDNLFKLIPADLTNSNRPQKL